MDKCKHRKTWLIAGGFVEWCYQRGAIRQMKRIEGLANGFTPAEKWIKPTGPNGQNPAMTENFLDPAPKQEPEK